MIPKIKSIKNLAVFKNFDWDKSVLNKNSEVQTFKKLNIIYGRNYSGKTTLSRIFRAIETGTISDKYENPEFSVYLGENTSIDQNGLLNHNETVRVFNTDFVNENLKFIVNSDDSIEPFAILGKANNEINTEIETLEDKLGSNEEGKETGLYKELKVSAEEFNLAHLTHKESKDSLDDQLTKKATSKDIGIKYKAELFGDQNYTTPKLRNDITTVLNESYTQIDEQKKRDLTKLIAEKQKVDIQPLEEKKFQSENFSNEVKDLVTQKISESGKIKELVENAMLNKWVDEGRAYHTDDSKCGFCNNPISTDRWQALESHFDEASAILDKDIDELIGKIQTEKKSIIITFDKNLFYSEFEDELDIIYENYKEVVEKHTYSLDSLISQLQDRKSDLIHPKEFKEVTVFTSEIEGILEEYENIRTEANKFTGALANKQKEARKTLRLREVFDFVITIGYVKKIESVNKLEKARDNKNAVYQEKVKAIDSKIKEIKNKKAQLNDEENGAIKVNDYLNNFFGHEFLTLRTTEEKSTDSEEVKGVRFEVIRGENKAYHLSEGECSLIAFCYFMAKLDDIETKGRKPIIWIDDPISSLDGNHIFFVYSLIKAEILKTENFQQLFISTHNLEFLKYLKRLPVKGNKLTNEFFIINREKNTSSVQVMPNYLKEYVTEFNYLFHQIYKCSKISEITDSNYNLFYNFGNNARKFLEIYLYYKYPDSSDNKMTMFLGDEIPTILAERVSNEFSHLNGRLEKGGIPIEQPEMMSTAKLIMQKLEEKDSDQYQALLRSIDESENNIVHIPQTG